MFSCTRDFLFPELITKRDSDDGLISCPLLAIVDKLQVCCSMGRTHKGETFCRTKTMPQGIWVTGERCIEPCGGMEGRNDSFFLFFLIIFFIILC